MRDLQTIVAENKAGKRASKPMDPNAARFSDWEGGGQSPEDKNIRSAALRRRARKNTPWK